MIVKVRKKLRKIKEYKKIEKYLGNKVIFEQKKFRVLEILKFWFVYISH